MSVEKLWDELWIGVKCQSNVEIAGSPRNSFRASLKVKSTGGRALIGLGAVKVTELCQTTNSVNFYYGSQTVGDKLHCQKGKSPDRQLRPQNRY